MRELSCTNSSEHLGVMPTLRVAVKREKIEPAKEGRLLSEHASRSCSTGLEVWLACCSVDFASRRLS